MEAARHWAGGGGKERADTEGDEECKDELRQFGVKEEDIERAFAARSAPDEDESEPDLFPLWPENERTVELFVRLRAQWHIVAGAGGVYWQGLRAEAIESVLRVARVPLGAREEMMDDLLAMADAAAQVLNRGSR